MLVKSNAKSSPDAASTPSAGRRWVKRAILLLSIVALALVATECVHQYEIFVAEREFFEVQAEIRLELGDPKDWTKWYRDRVPKDDPRDSIAAWNGECRHLYEKHRLVVDQLREARWRPDHAARPADEMTEAFLRDTECVAARGRKLLEFERLHVPHEVDAKYRFFGFSIHSVWDARIRALAVGLDPARAWSELELLFNVAAKFAHEACWEDSAFGEQIELRGHELLVVLARGSKPPGGFNATCANPPQRRDEQGRAESLAAEIAQWNENPVLLFGTIDDRFEDQWRRPFSWLEASPPFFSTFTFVSTAATTRKKAQRAASLLAALRLLKTGQTPNRTDAEELRLVEIPQLAPLRQRSVSILRIRATQARQGSVEDELAKTPVPGSIQVGRVAQAWELRWNPESREIQQAGLFDILETEASVVLPDLAAD